MASAKLANSTVNHSQSAIWIPNFRPAAPVNMSRTRNTVVSSAPTSTTNITGFFASVTGFSFTNDAWIARLTISGSNSGRDRASFLGRSEVGSSCRGALGVVCGVVVTVDMCVSSRAAR